MNNKEYIFSLRTFIIIACLIFIFSLFNGYFFARSSPSETGMVLEELQEMFGSILKLPSLGQFLFILLNNSITAFLAILLGIIFGIFPFLILFSNGTVLGIVAYSLKTSFSWSMFFVGTVPHGIIEIPVIILACAIGFRLGKVFFKQLFKKEGDIKTELNFALDFFLKFLFPLLILAAAIEVFITARLLE